MVKTLTLVVLLAAQYTILKHIHPGHRNYIEVCGVLLVIIGNIFAALDRKNQLSVEQLVEEMKGRGCIEKAIQTDGGANKADETQNDTCPCSQDHNNNIATWAEAYSTKIHYEGEKEVLGSPLANSAPHFTTVTVAITHL